MTERPRNPSDLSDARWEPIEPALTAWRDRRRAGALDIGRPPEHDLRTIMDAILYVDRTGIPWPYLPHDHPPCRPSGLLYRLARVHQGRLTEPSAAVIDPQSVKTSTNVPAADQGMDAAKKKVGVDSPVRRRATLSIIAMWIMAWELIARVS